MVLGFGNTQTAWDKADVAVDDLLKAARTLYKAVEPDPANMGIIGAGSIGGKAEATRQAINKSNKTLAACAAAEPDGKMKKEHTESVVRRVEDNLPLLLDVLKRMSAVHYHRFCEIGMGLPTVVKVALGWIESSTKEWMTTFEGVNKTPELVERIQSIRDRLLSAEAEALDVYKGIGQ